MKMYKVKKPFDNRMHLASRQLLTTSYGKQIEVYEIVKPFNLGLYTKSELEYIENKKK